MKVSDFIYKFKVSWAIENFGLCRVRLFINNVIAYLVITDIGLDNTGPSVTNSIEMIVAQLEEEGKFSSVAPVIIEHYEKPTPQFDIVSIDGPTTWQRVSFDDVVALIDCDADEFLAHTSTILSLQKQLISLRNSINPLFGMVEYQDHNWDCRLRYIWDQAKSKDELDSLIHAKSNERQLQNFFKEDLSFFGEAYSHPLHEYICFSEFPVGDTGFVDFVVFTGRSRMDVWLIEIKGSNFFLTTNCHYEQHNAEISKAIKQLQDRKIWIDRNYPAFRKEVHSIKSRVENGETIYNSFPGALDFLQVDPNKDINCHFAVIGGRDRDNCRDSRYRTNCEMNNFVSLLDTWDSFLRKLRR